MYFRVMEELKNDKNTSISFHSSLKIWRESCEFLSSFEGFKIECVKNQKMLWLMFCSYNIINLDPPTTRYEH